MRNELCLMLVLLILKSCQLDSSMVKQWDAKNQEYLPDRIEDDRVVRIPFENDNPYPLMAFDVDKDEYRLFVSNVAFQFEISGNSEDKGIINPVSEYKDKYFSLIMEKDKICRLTIFKQDKPYGFISKKVVFYNLGNEVIEEVAIVIGEDASNMEY